MQPTTAPSELTDKKARYEFVTRQIQALVADESDTVANMANIVSVLKYSFNHMSWVGFYLLKGDELVLGPFQGKPACVRIKMGKGVCGTAAQERRSLIVADVSRFPGHIYCDPGSKSEIVVPIIQMQKLLGVLDVDSNNVNAFEEIDKVHLEVIASLVRPE